MTKVIEFPKERAGIVEARQELGNFIFTLAIQKHVNGLLKEMKIQYFRGVIDGVSIAGVVVMMSLFLKYIPEIVYGSL